MITISCLIDWTLNLFKSKLFVQVSRVFLIAFISLCLGMDPHDVIDGINDGSIEVPEE